jgi:hypothetical protein
MPIALYAGYIVIGNKNRPRESIPSFFFNFLLNEYHETKRISYCRS